MVKSKYPKVWVKKNGKYIQKIVTIPQNSKIQEGDYVKIIKVEEE